MDYWNIDIVKKSEKKSLFLNVWIFICTENSKWSEEMRLEEETVSDKLIQLQ